MKIHTAASLSVFSALVLFHGVSSFSALPNNFPRGSNTQYDATNPYPSNNPYGYNDGNMIMDRSRQRAAEALNERRQTPGSYNANDWHSHAGAAKGYSQSQFSTYAEQRREEADYQRRNNNWQHRNMNRNRVQREEGPMDYQRQMNYNNNNNQRDLFDYNNRYDPYYDPARLDTTRMDPIDRHGHKAAQASMNRGIAGRAGDPSYYERPNRGPGSFQDQRRRDVEADFPRNQYQGNDMFRRQENYRMPNNYAQQDPHFGRMEPGAYARNDWWEKAGRNDNPYKSYNGNNSQGNFMTYSDQRAEAAWEEKNRNRFPDYSYNDDEGYRSDGRRRYKYNGY